MLFLAKLYFRLVPDSKYQLEHCKESIPFFQLLSDAEIASLSDNSSTVKYRKKDNIFRQGTRTSHIMILMDGLVKVYKESRSDRYIILRMAKPGSYLGILSLLVLTYNFFFFVTILKHTLFSTWHLVADI